jgi:hypothetical protein
MGEKVFAGVSKIDITPPLGYRLQGHGMRKKPSQRIHDPLNLKVLTVKKGNDRVAIITFDLLGLSVDFVLEAREEIKKKTGLLANQVMMCASHTHSGPFVLPAPDGTMDENFIPDYLPLLIKQTAGAIIEAISREEEVNLVYGKSTIDIGSINRRKKNPDGSIWGPDPEGPVDREVSVLSFEKSVGNPVSILFTYGCHPTTVNTSISDITAEYPGTAQHELERFYSGSTALFTNGCSGDVRPSLTNEEKTAFKAGDFNDVKRMGRLLAAGTIEAIETARMKNKTASLNIKSVAGYLETFQFPLNKDFLPVDEESIEKNFLILVKKFRGNYKAFESELKWKKMWKEKLLKGDPVPETVDADVQVIKIGDISLIGFPGDTMAEIGLKIKQKIPYAIPISNSNGRIGYIPSAQGLKDGGYEASFFFYQGFPGPYAPEMESELIKKVVELTERQ